MTTYNEKKTREEIKSFLSSNFPKLVFKSFRRSRAVLSTGQCKFNGFAFWAYYEDENGNKDRFEFYINNGVLKFGWLGGVEYNEKSYNINNLQN